MGFGRFVCLLLLVWFSCSLSSTYGYRFYVGGRDGWVLNPSENYNHWAERNRFRVNDTLYFKYKKGSDSVLEVNKDDYFNCNTKNPIQKLEGGDSEFRFVRSGPFFFISGQNGTCEKGQKLIVIVLALSHHKPIPAPHAQPPAAAQPPSSPPASGPSPSTSTPTSSPVPSPSTSTPTSSPVPSPSTSTPTTSPVPSPSTSTPTTSPVPSPSTSTPTTSPVPSPSTSTPTTSPVPSPSTSTPTTSPVPSPSAQTPPPPTTSPSPGEEPEGPTPPGATSPPPGSANSTAPGSSGTHAVTPSSLLVSWVVLLVSVALMSSSSFGQSGALSNN